MPERRKLKRRHLIYCLRVFDKHTDQLMGHLVDISTEGIMLMSEEPVDTGATFHFRMSFPEEIEGARHLAFDATSQWCRHDANPSFFDTGFELVGVSDQDRQVITALIEEFHADEPEDTEA